MENEMNMFTFRVIGNSMDNGTRSSFEEGDKVFVKLISIYDFKRNIVNEPNSYWLIITGEEVLFKQVMSFNEIEGIKCHSLNQNGLYPDVFIAFDNIRAIYRVMQKQAKTVCYGI